MRSMGARGRIPDAQRKSASGGGGLTSLGGGGGGGGEGGGYEMPDCRSCDRISAGLSTFAPSYQAHAEG
jgi:hypothetical protein